MDRKAESNQQGKRPKRLPDRNPRMIHNTLSVGKDKRDMED